jgi:hypothetical protein
LREFQVTPGIRNENPAREEIDMKTKAKRVLIILALLGVMNLAVVPVAFGADYSGKIDTVEVVGEGTTGTTRFFVSQKKLSLYAKGDFKDLLLRGFFQKASMDMGYTVITCPPGILGTCGQIFFVSSDSQRF